MQNDYSCMRLDFFLGAPLKASSVHLQVVTFMFLQYFHLSRTIHVFRVHCCPSKVGVVTLVFVFYIPFLDCFRKYFKKEICRFVVKIFVYYSLCCFPDQQPASPVSWLQQHPWVVRELLWEPVQCWRAGLHALVPVPRSACNAGLAGWEHGPQRGGFAAGHCACFVYLDFTVSLGFYPVFFFHF